MIDLQEPRVITEENIGLEFARFRLNPDWRSECMLAGTETPGVFYHGSPNVNIEQFRSEGVEKNDVRTSGVFFSQSPTYAAMFAMRGTEGKGGRVYSVELETRHPFVADPDWWVEHVADPADREVEAAICDDTRADGFDSIVSLAEDETVLEIIVLVDDAIHSRESTVRLKDWTSPTVSDALMFFQPNDPGCPDYAPGCTPLQATNRSTDGKTCVGRKVLVDALNPIYCSQAAWPKMDFDVLRFLEVDCLIDPDTRGALVLNPAKIVPMNRAMLRDVKSRQRKGRA